ncbi:glycine betaine ABC transporter substrate-binding protein [Salirhabdus salicampi]|uniref:glycine betaine ABC transporter substrate-binding protein n=1 Tax=Salirhabdus salicampi TaxID=476102 RepID=UPI0020C1C8BD|nr:glycine betaine ABC transporter substrate-binding protein [Salirhabdus salicampi]MCP8617286.1 glycine betaine ABC transporter substrate-binding protein [Salirhabdus salicampi]
MKDIVFKKTFVVICLLGLLVGCGGGNDNNNNEGGNQEEETITLGLTPWSSTVPPTEVARLILEDMGYKVETTKADAGGIYTGLSRGDIDVFMDSWLPDMHANYMDQFGENIDDTALSYPNGELGWVVPEYVDINSIDEIKGNEDLFDGKIYGIEEGAGMTATTREMLEGYDLDLELVNSSEGGMLAQASRFINQNEPVLFLGWRPHPMFVNYDLKVLKDPKGYFKTSEVHVLTNKDFKDRVPEAYEFLSRWSIDVEDVEHMIVEIDGGRDAEEVAQEWIDNNQDKVDQMRNGDDGGDDNENEGENGNNNGNDNENGNE